MRISYSYSCGDGPSLSKFTTTTQETRWLFNSQY